MKVAVGYIRVSTEEQAQDGRYGREAQRKAIEKYAAANGYYIARWYEDTGSGVSDDRPEWNRILYDEGEINNPPYSAVISYKSDRIARDMKLYFYYLYCLEKRKVKLLAAQEDFGENIDPSLANIYRSLMMFVAEQERKNIALRTSAGRTLKASKGAYSGGRAPYGYEIKDGQLVVVPEEAEMIRAAYKLRDEGATMTAVAAVLTKMGYRTRSGHTISTNTVYALYHHESLYRGKYSYGGVRDVEGRHEAILPKLDEPARAEGD